MQLKHIYPRPHIYRVSKLEVRFLNKCIRVTSTVYMHANWYSPAYMGMSSNIIIARKTGPLRVFCCKSTSPNKL